MRPTYSQLLAIANTATANRGVIEATIGLLESGKPDERGIAIDALKGLSAELLDESRHYASEARRLRIATPV